MVTICYHLILCFLVWMAPLKEDYFLTVIDSSTSFEQAVSKCGPTVWHSHPLYAVIGKQCGGEKGARVWTSKSCSLLAFLTISVTFSSEQPSETQQTSSRSDWKCYRVSTLYMPFRTTKRKYWFLRKTCCWIQTTDLSNACGGSCCVFWCDWISSLQHTRASCYYFWKSHSLTHQYLTGLAASVTRCFCDNFKKQKCMLFFQHATSFFLLFFYVTEDRRTESIVFTSMNIITRPLNFLSLFLCVNWKSLAILICG